MVVSISVSDYSDDPTLAESSQLSIFGVARPPVVRMKAPGLSLGRGANNFPDAAHVLLGGEDIAEAETHHDAAA